MNILAIDQARHGGWSVFNYESKDLVTYGDFNFDSSKFAFDDCIVSINELVQGLLHTYGCSAVFFEDIQMQKNVDSFKKLAQLQGSLIYMCRSHEYLYDIVKPSQWQNYCKARGRTSKEIKAKVTSVDDVNKKQSKVLSLQYIRDVFGVDTNNDNIADSICIGNYVVNNIPIRIKGE